MNHYSDHYQSLSGIARVDQREYKNLAHYRLAKLVPVSTRMFRQWVCRLSPQTSHKVAGVPARSYENKALA